jgi:ribonucleoside-diphosphate reductase alpha chain
MQTATVSSEGNVTAKRAAAPAAAVASVYQGYQILRRNGAVVAFEPNKIAVALMA